jgi:uncharacterized membrane protein
MNRTDRKVVCQICGKETALHSAIPGDVIRESLRATIRKRKPDWPGTGYVCREDMDHFRVEHVQDLLEQDKGDLGELEKQVIKSMQEEDLLSRNLNAEFDQKLTGGQKLADKMADVAGSWGFITGFLLVLVGWIAVNSIYLLRRPFDPFPFILLNLVLSCIAALQAPVIMMSQNRQESKDRLRAEHDYRINLKAELEIRTLNGKIDQLITHQWQRLLEIQEIQLELLEEHRGNRAPRAKE